MMAKTRQWKLSAGVRRGFVKDCLPQIVSTLSERERREACVEGATALALRYGRPKKGQ